MRQQKSFLLKCWSDSPSQTHWRASLEDIQTKEKQYFADLDLLIETLSDLKLNGSQASGGQEIIGEKDA